MSGLANFMPALRRVRMLVLDVDGVLTDGRLFYGARGESLKVFHVRDGHGIKQVAAAGITVAIISGRKSAAVARRARELGIRHVSQGISDKLDVLGELGSPPVALEIGLRRRRHARYADVPGGGTAMAVADAHPEALAAPTGHDRAADAAR